MMRGCVGIDWMVVGCIESDSDMEGAVNKACQDWEGTVWDTGNGHRSLAIDDR